MYFGKDKLKYAICVILYATVFLVRLHISKSIIEPKIGEGL